MFGGERVPCTEWHTPCSDERVPVSCVSGVLGCKWSALCHHASTPVRVLEERCVVNLGNRGDSSSRGSLVILHESDFREGCVGHISTHVTARVSRPGVVLLGQAVLR